MAVSYVDSTDTLSATAVMPSHQAGDYIIAFAWRTGSTTAPSVASGYTDMNGGGNGTPTMIATRVARKVAASSSETAPTFTNATGVILVVYRGVTSVGVVTADVNNNNSTVSYPALTLDNTNGSSWVARFAAHATATNMLTNTPSGYTQRTGNATGRRAIDTNGVTSTNPTSVNQSVDNAGAWRAFSLEIKGAVPTSAANSGFFAFA